MSNPKSCAGCKFLYGDGSGYSDFTWMNTYVRCALSKNQNLIQNQEQLAFWPPTSDRDEWEPTRSFRCDAYAPGAYIVLSPERSERPDQLTNDPVQIAAITKCEIESGRTPWWAAQENPDV